MSAAFNQKTIYVYDSFSNNDPVLMGILHVDVIRGSESYSFEYNTNWLSRSNHSYYMDPFLAPYSGRQFHPENRLWGLFSDASPDRWGRVLMNRRERVRAIHEKRKPHRLNDSDYLLGVYDMTRMGGLRFKTEPDGEFVSCDHDFPVPPWERLRTLEEASRRFESGDMSDDRWLRQLMNPGSSLGGARPKATVKDENGQLWIAKFPSRHDDNNSGAWEKVVHDLAGMCDLCVPEARVQRLSDFGSTFLVRRFDRDAERRIHFASAMTLLGKSDGASAADGTGYLDIASFIRASGADPAVDLREIWKRIVFSMAVSNTDDHLRNHAFILTDAGWKLSPMYDVNPVPYGTELALSVDTGDNRIDIDLAISTAHKYGITSHEARAMADEIVTVVKDNWRKLALENDLTRKQIEDMMPAFEL